jgi:hypothetical protein
LPSGLYGKYFSARHIEAAIKCHGDHRHSECAGIICTII